MATFYSSSSDLVSIRLHAECICVHESVSKMGTPMTTENKVTPPNNCIFSWIISALSAVFCHSDEINTPLNNCIFFWIIYALSAGFLSFRRKQYAAKHLFFSCKISALSVGFLSFGQNQYAVNNYIFSWIISALSVGFLPFRRKQYAAKQLYFLLDDICVICGFSVIWTKTIRRQTIVFSVG